jgi:signal recognition particle subunit SRP54
MVLAELGRKITAAFARLTNESTLDEKVLKEVLEEICLALLHADVKVRYVKELREGITSRLLAMESVPNVKRAVQTEVVNELVRLLSVEKKPFAPVRGKANVVMFVGLQGSGKTTTCGKYANYYQKKGWRVALVCSDTFRAGAFEQLKQNATRIRVPFYGNEVETDPVQIAARGVEIFKKEGFELIIIDTSGRHKQEAGLFEEMRQIESVVRPNDVIFIMDSSIGQNCFDQAAAFKKAVQVGSVIISKLDGHAKGGGAISAVAATQSPINFIGTGEHFEDFEPFEAASFVKRLLGLGDIHKLIDRMKSVVSAETQAEIMAKIKKGKFGLRELRGQFESILKLGSMNSFLSLLPGAGNGLLNKDNEEESIRRIKRYICMMDSMTEQEVDAEVAICPSRMRRIARGSGTHVEEVALLLEEYKRLKGMIDKVGPANVSKLNDLRNFERNPGQYMDQLKKMIDPRMLGQLGGMDNLMSMVKGMSKDPSFLEMQKEISQATKKLKK